jgi:hypothetical protein
LGRKSEWALAVPQKGRVMHRTLRSLTGSSGSYIHYLDLYMIRYLTGGFLLQELLSNPLLRDCGCVAIDEAHETTVATDILLAMEVTVSHSLAIPSSKISRNLRLIYLFHCARASAAYGGSTRCM